MGALPWAGQGLTCFQRSALRRERAWPVPGGLARVSPSCWARGGSGGGRPAPGWRRCRGGQRFLALRAVHTFPWRSRRAPRPPCACVSHTFRAPGALGRQQAPLSSQRRQCLCARRDTRPSVPAVCGASVDRICPPPRPVGLPVCPGGFLGVSPVVNSKSPKCSLNDNHCSCSRV